MTTITLQSVILNKRLYRKSLLWAIKYQLNVDIKRRNVHITGDIVSPATRTGLDFMQNHKLNKGLAFTLEERQLLGIHGLQPAVVKTQAEQVELCKLRLSKCKDDMEKFLYLMDLHGRNERLFFRVLTENLRALLPIVYTPTVAMICLDFGYYFRRQRALFVSATDQGHVYDVVKNWPEPDVRASVITDGERILGLGDLGVNGVCISVGKMGLYTALARLKPHVCMPIVLDVGTNTERLLKDPFYVGLRQKRMTGPKYDELVDELLQALVKRFGQRMLIQFEDFGNSNAFRFLDKYREQYCVFNDDIQGTAGAAVAGLYAVERMIGTKIGDHKYLFLGAGEAAVGIADLCVKYMTEKDGTSIEEARAKIWMHDVHGLLTKNRPEGLGERQSVYAVDCEPMKNFADVVNLMKPTILIGVCTVGKLFTPEILKAMASFNERPVIFALSNPNIKAECTPKECYENTEGRAIYASGSPFNEVEYNGKLYVPGQGNNAYIYPGISLGAIVSGIRHISDDVLLLAARCVSDLVTDEHLKNGTVYPPLQTLTQISLDIAVKMMEYAFEHDLASVYPEPCDKRAYIENELYDYCYDCALPTTYAWPTLPKMKVDPLPDTVLKASEKLK